jgi:hypothetical protein
VFRRLYLAQLANCKQIIAKPRRETEKDQLEKRRISPSCTNPYVQSIEFGNAMRHISQVMSFEVLLW